MTLNKVIYIFLLAQILLIGNSGLTYASNVIEFGPKESRINGSIKYSVVGKYLASFDNFKGKIAIDEKSYVVQSVDLEIQVSCIRSNCSYIYRKDFGIIWNALLDKGGILVGNNITVDWSIRRQL